LSLIQTSRTKETSQKKTSSNGRLTTGSTTPIPWPAATSWQALAKNSVSATTFQRAPFRELSPPKSPLDDFGVAPNDGVHAAQGCSRWRSLDFL